VARRWATNSTEGYLESDDFVSYLYHSTVLVSVIKTAQKPGRKLARRTAVSSAASVVPYAGTPG
jgi:hypothetical protein